MSMPARSCIGSKNPDCQAHTCEVLKYSGVVVLQEEIEQAGAPYEQEACPQGNPPEASADAPAEQGTPLPEDPVGTPDQVTMAVPQQAMQQVQQPSQVREPVAAPEQAMQAAAPKQAVDAAMPEQATGAAEAAEIAPGGWRIKKKHNIDAPADAPTPPAQHGMTL